MEIRDATEADLPGILAIYNDAVLNTTAIWNETPVDLDNRLAWWRGRRAQDYPVLVAAEDGDIVGYASFGDWRAFDGYRHTVEHSIYLAPGAQALGVGRKLMEPLIDRARALGKHVMVAGIEAGNEVSIRFHERLGFVVVGHLREVGIKYGRWLDLAFLQLML
ncbi:MAG: GNAT family N-acetyltransferase [Zavarzinia sp.]|nr:GNAT family N-acetyltransferase [Zavarzinia sp.]